MKRVPVLLLVVALVALPATTGAQSAAVYVSNVTVSPQTPAPGEQFTVTTSVVNGQSSQSSIEIADVAIQTADGNRELKRIENLGTLPPGTSMDIPMTLSFSDPGTRELRVVVYGRREDTGRVQIRRPVVVNVRQGGPQLSVETGDPVVGAETDVTVTMVNGENTTAKSLRLSLDGQNVDVDDAARVAASLPPGQERVFNFTATPTARDAALTATLRYVTGDGSERTVRQTVDLTADPLREDVRVDASVASEGDSPPVTVDVSNFGNAPLTDVVVTASANGTTYARRSVDDVPAEGSRTVRLNLSNADGVDGQLDVGVSYRTGGAQGTAQTQVTYAANPARIELTGVSFEREGDHLLVSGSASNLGLSDASSVVVSVVSADGVTPVSPNREYFVGTVPASDFVSFDLTAQVDDGVEQIPIRVSYIAGGIRRSEVVRIDAADAPASGQSGNEGNSGGGPSLLLLLGGAIALVVVVGVAAYAYVRR